MSTVKALIKEEIMISNLFTLLEAIILCGLQLMFPELGV